MFESKPNVSEAYKSYTQQHPHMLMVQIDRTLTGKDLCDLQQDFENGIKFADGKLQRLISKSRPNSTLLYANDNAYRLVARQKSSFDVSDIQCPNVDKDKHLIKRYFDRHDNIEKCLFCKQKIELLLARF